MALRLSTSIFLIATILLSLSIQQGECEVRFTPCDRKDDRECGIFCYDPKTETCTTGGFVCAIGEIVCTDVCYNPLTQNCYTNKIDEGVVCDKVSERFCGEKCIGATENCVDV